MNVIKDLWKDKPLFITVVVGLAALLYIVYKNTSGSAVTAPASTDAPASVNGAGPGPGNGTFVEYSYYNNTPISNTYTGTVSAPAAPTPAPITPVAAPPHTAPPSTGKPAAPAQRTVTVTPWPTRNSTLSGIAQSAYGNASLWPKIYAANKSKIGNNPNLIYAGTVLTIPA